MLICASQLSLIYFTSFITYIYYCFFYFCIFHSIAKLDRCPMCRAPINSYFCIRNEDYVPPNTHDAKQNKTKVAVNWIDALNDRLTDFLGFR